MTSNTLLTTFTWLLLALFLGSPLMAQVDSTQSGSPADNSWWKGLFRQTVPSPSELGCTDPPTEVDSMEHGGSMHAPWKPRTPVSPDSATSIQLAPGGVGSVTWIMDSRIQSLDSLGKSEAKPIQGYRIQIYFGSLSEARAVKASFRKDFPEVSCQLLPISPNYAVTVGNFRNQWEARRALDSGEVGQWTNALVIPSEIDFPVD